MRSAGIVHSFASKSISDQRLPMTELPLAFARMGSRQVRGKLVMTNP